MKTIFRMEHIVKAFPGVVALKDISIDIDGGLVYGLVGENGAGKSTLIKILSGVYKQDSGTVYMHDQPVSFTSPSSSQNSGIHVMHQDIKVIPNLSIAENIFLNRLSTNKVFVNYQKINMLTNELLKEVGLQDTPANTLMQSLNIADQQMVNLARILSTNPKIVLFDEPTASLTKTEVEKLFNVIERLKSKGVTIIYISHYLEEVLKVSDKIIILRDGRHIGTYISSEMTKQDIATKMVGHEVLQAVPCPPSPDSPVRLKVKDLCSPQGVDHVTLNVKMGEIVGLYGLNGAKKSECLLAICGIDKKIYGSISVDGISIYKSNMIESVNHGMVLVPEDRRQKGLVLCLSVKDNINLGYEKAHTNRLGLISKKREKENTARYIDLLHVKSPSDESLVSTLSGGNQQKVVLSRCIGSGAKVFLLDEPTVGIDVNARTEIYHLIQNIAEMGSAVLIASSDLTEVLEICSKIYILRNGKIVKEIDREDANEENLLLYATGEDNE